MRGAKLAVTGERRQAKLPDVLTGKESGIGGKLINEMGIRAE
jgi:hypothetical protein